MNKTITQSGALFEVHRRSRAKRVISWHTYNGGFWVRILGIGFSLEDRTKRAALFSERNGLRPVLRIGRYAATILSRSSVPTRSPRTVRVNRADLSRNGKKLIRNA
jgi:hypothetical protein